MTPTPWKKSPAYPNSSYLDSWTSNITKDGFFVAFVYGHTKEEADTNAQMIITSVNNFNSMQAALNSIASTTITNTALQSAKSIAASALDIKAEPIPLFTNTYWCTKKPLVELPNSNELVKELVNQTTWGGKAWINYYEYSTPLYFVNSSTPKYPLQIIQNGKPLGGLKLYEECIKGVPIPSNAVPAAGNDKTITIIDVDTKKLYDFWLFENNNGNYQAAWGGILNNVDTDGTMPMPGGERWGATATGLPAIAGTILYSELEKGVIPHALAFAIPKCKNISVAPATGNDGQVDGLIPQGTKFQFPKDIEINPTWAPIMKMMVTAVRDYGMYLRDTSYAVNFYAEDVSQYKDKPYWFFFGEMQIWDLMPQFPWNKLKAVNF